MLSACERVNQLNCVDAELSERRDKWRALRTVQPSVAGESLEGLVAGSGAQVASQLIGHDVLYLSSGGAAVVKISIETVNRSETTQLGGVKAGLEDFVSRAPELQDALASIANELGGVLDKCEPNKNGWGLQEVVVQLELALSAEVGVIVTKATGSAAIRAEFKWARAALDA